MSLCKKCNNNKKCKECGGEGMVKEEVKLKIVIPRGVFNDYPIEIDNVGHAVFPEHVDAYGSERSSLICVVKEMPHQIFKRYVLQEKRKLDFSDIAIELNISLSESFIGFNKTITFLDDTDLEININESTRHNDIFVIKKKGMPIYDFDDYGDLFVFICVEHPKEILGKLSKQQKTNITDIFGEAELPNKKTTSNLIPIEKYKAEAKMKATAEEHKQRYEQRNNGHSHGHGHEQGFGFGFGGGSQTAECVHQ
jgi:DnaJ-class molecular chaperone